jgi:hypothetical protein
MDAPKPLEEIALEIGGVVDQLITSLREALIEADNFHRDNDYDPGDDPALVSGLVRRYVRERAIAALPGVVDPASNMSPILLHLGPYRLRVLHVHDGGLPPAQSHARAAYYAFNEQGVLALNVWSGDLDEDLDPSETVVEEYNLVLLWDSKGTMLTDATLVRPWGKNPSEFLDLLTVEVPEEDLDEITKRKDLDGTDRKAANDTPRGVVDPGKRDQEGGSDEDPRR